MADPTLSAPELFSLRLPNEPGAVRVALAATAAQLRELAFPKDAIEQIEMVVQEACANVLKHAYRPGERASFVLECELELSKLKLRIVDQGLPYDPYHAPHFSPDSAESQGLGLYLMQRLAPEMRFVSLGREGKALELLFPLPRGAESATSETAQSSGLELPPVDPSSLRVRAFRADDAGEVAQVAYEVYGYSYFGEHVYVPERLIEMNARGELTSAVVVDGEDRVVGHLALIYSPERVIPEEGQAFVSPRARGGGSLTKLKQFLFDVAERRALPGVFSDGVTVHPFTQKANLALGSRECGLLLAFAPGDVQFKAIHQADDHRHSLVVFYKPLVAQQRGRAYLPARHAEMIRAIYANVGVALEELAEERPLAERTVIDVSANALRGIGYLTVRAFGPDLVEQLAHQRRLLTAHGMVVIQLDLPMDHPAAARLAPEIEELGFFFAGAVPHYFGEAPTLRYQLLNDVRPDGNSIVLASDFAKRLYDYVAAGAGL